MPSILFVCTANQCRSPVAEVALRQAVGERDDHDQWEIASAGTWARSGRRADRGMTTAAQKHGLDLSAHRAQPVSADLLAAYDRVLTMEAGHKEALQMAFPAYRDRVQMLSEAVGPPFDVADPIGGPTEEYDEAVQLIVELVQDLLRRY